MPIDMFALYSDKKASSLDLAAIVMCRWKHQIRVRGNSVVKMTRTIIALQYVVEGEHRLASFCCSIFYSVYIISHSIHVIFCMTYNEMNQNTCDKYSHH